MNPRLGQKVAKRRSQMSLVEPKSPLCSGNRSEPKEGQREEEVEVGRRCIQGKGENHPCMSGAGECDCRRRPLPVAMITRKG